MNEQNIASSQEPNGVFAALASIGSALSKGAKAVGAFFGLSIKPTEVSDTAMRIRASVTAKQESSWWSAVKCFFGYRTLVPSEEVAQNDEESDDNQTRRSSVLMMEHSSKRLLSVNGGGADGLQRDSDMTRASRAGRNSTTVTSERLSEIGRKRLAYLFGAPDSQFGQAPSPQTSSTNDEAVDLMTAAKGENEKLEATLAQEQQEAVPMVATNSTTNQTSRSSVLPSQAGGRVGTGEDLEKAKRKADAEAYVAAEQAKVAKAREQAQESLSNCYGKIALHIGSSALTSEQRTELLSSQKKFNEELETKSISESKTNLKAIIDKLEKLEIALSSSTALSKAADGFARLTGYVTGSPKGGKGILNEQLQSLPYHNELRAEVDKIEG